jgi:hypothetical protein
VETGAGSFAIAQGFYFERGHFMTLLRKFGDGDDPDRNFNSEGIKQKLSRAFQGEVSEGYLESRALNRIA